MPDKPVVSNVEPVESTEPIESPEKVANDLHVQATGVLQNSVFHSPVHVRRNIDKQKEHSQQLQDIVSHPHVKPETINMIYNHFVDSASGDPSIHNNSGAALMSHVMRSTATPQTVKDDFVDRHLRAMTGGKYSSNDYASEIYTDMHKDTDDQQPVKISSPIYHKYIDELLNKAVSSEADAADVYRNIDYYLTQNVNSDYLLDKIDQLRSDKRYGSMITNRLLPAALYTKHSPESISKLINVAHKLMTENVADLDDEHKAKILDTLSDLVRFDRRDQKIVQSQHLDTINQLAPDALDYIIKHPNVDPVLLSKVALDPQNSLRYEAMSNSKLPQPTLNKIIDSFPDENELNSLKLQAATDAEGIVSRSATATIENLQDTVNNLIYNESLNKDQINKIYSSGFPSILGHQNTPPELKEACFNHRLKEFQGDKNKPTAPDYYQALVSVMPQTKNLPEHILVDVINHMDSGTQRGKDRLDHIAEYIMNNKYLEPSQPVIDLLASKGVKRAVQHPSYIYKSFINAIDSGDTYNAGELFYDIDKVKNPIDHDTLQKFVSMYTNDLGDRKNFDVAMRLSTHPAIPENIQHQIVDKLSQNFNYMNVDDQQYAATLFTRTFNEKLGMQITNHYEALRHLDNLPNKEIPTSVVDNAIKTITSVPVNNLTCVRLKDALSNPNCSKEMFNIGFDAIATTDLARFLISDSAHYNMLDRQSTNRSPEEIKKLFSDALHKIRNNPHIGTVVAVAAIRGLILTAENVPSDTVDYIAFNYPNMISQALMEPAISDRIINKMSENTKMSLIRSSNSMDVKESIISALDPAKPHDVDFLIKYFNYGDVLPPNIHNSIDSLFYQKPEIMNMTQQLLDSNPTSSAGIELVVGQALNMPEIFDADSDSYKRVELLKKYFNNATNLQVTEESKADHINNRWHEFIGLSESSWQLRDELQKWAKYGHLDFLADIFSNDSDMLYKLWSKSYLSEDIGDGLFLTNVGMIKNLGTDQAWRFLSKMNDPRMVPEVLNRLLEFNLIEPRKFYKWDDRTKSTISEEGQLKVIDNYKRIIDIVFDKNQGLNDNSVRGIKQFLHSIPKDSNIGSAASKKITKEIAEHIIAKQGDIQYKLDIFDHMLWHTGSDNLMKIHPVIGEFVANNTTTDTQGFVKMFQNPALTGELFVQLPTMLNNITNSPDFDSIRASLKTQFACKDAGGFKGKDLLNVLNTVKARINDSTLDKSSIDMLESIRSTICIYGMKSLITDSDPTGDINYKLKKTTKDYYHFNRECINTLFDAAIADNDIDAYSSLFRLIESSSTSNSMKKDIFLRIPDEVIGQFSKSTSVSAHGILVTDSEILEKSGINKSAALVNDLTYLFGKKPTGADLAYYTDIAKVLSNRLIDTDIKYAKELMPLYSRIIEQDIKIDNNLCNKVFNAVDLADLMTVLRKRDSAVYKSLYYTPLITDACRNKLENFINSNDNDFRGAFEFTGDNRLKSQFRSDLEDIGQYFHELMALSTSHILRYNNDPNNAGSAMPDLMKNFDLLDKFMDMAGTRMSNVTDLENVEQYRLVQDHFKMFHSLQFRGLDWDWGSNHFKCDYDDAQKMINTILKPRELFKKICKQANRFPSPSLYGDLSENDYGITSYNSVDKVDNTICYIITGSDFDSVQMIDTFNKHPEYVVQLLPQIKLTSNIVDSLNIPEIYSTNFNSNEDFLKFLQELMLNSQSPSFVKKIILDITDKYAGEEFHFSRTGDDEWSKFIVKMLDSDVGRLLTGNDIADLAYSMDEEFDTFRGNRLYWGAAKRGIGGVEFLNKYIDLAKNSVDNYKEHNGDPTIIDFDPSTTNGFNSVKACFESPIISTDQINNLLKWWKDKDQDISDFYPTLMENPNTPPSIVDSMADNLLENHNKTNYEQLSKHPYLNKDKYISLYKKYHPRINSVNQVFNKNEPFPAAFVNSEHGAELFRSLNNDIPGNISNIDSDLLINSADASDKKMMSKFADALSKISPQGINWAEFKKANPQLADTHQIRKVFLEKEKNKGAAINRLVMPEDLIKAKNTYAKTYHVTYSSWSSMQRHISEGNTNLVLQFNTSKELEQTLKQNPRRWKFFQLLCQVANHVRVHDNQQVGGHPVTPFTLAWARVDTSQSDALIIEELQSDFSSRLRREIEQVKEHNGGSSFNLGDDKNAERFTYEEAKQFADDISDAIEGWRDAAIEAVEDLAKKQGKSEVYIHGENIRSMMSFHHCDPHYDGSRDYPVWLTQAYRIKPVEHGYEKVDYSDYPRYSSSLLGQVKKAGASTHCWRKKIK